MLDQVSKGAVIAGAVVVSLGMSGVGTVFLGRLVGVKDMTSTFKCGVAGGGAQMAVMFAVDEVAKKLSLSPINLGMKMLIGQVARIPSAYCGLRAANLFKDKPSEEEKQLGWDRDDYPSLLTGEDVVKIELVSFAISLVAGAALYGFLLYSGESISEIIKELEKKQRDL